jgi:hypothetical protein
MTLCVDLPGCLGLLIAPWANSLIILPCRHHSDASPVRVKANTWPSRPDAYPRISTCLDKPYQGWMQSLWAATRMKHSRVSPSQKLVDHVFPRDFPRPELQEIYLPMRPLAISLRGTRQPHQHRNAMSLYVAVSFQFLMIYLEVASYIVEIYPRSHTLQPFVAVQTLRRRRLPSQSGLDMLRPVPPRAH